MESVDLKSIVQDYYNLPDSFELLLVDDKHLQNSDHQFELFLRSKCWVYVKDLSNPTPSKLAKYAIHQTSWKDLLSSVENELSIVFDKCSLIQNLFLSNSSDGSVLINKANNVKKKFSHDQILYFTTEDQLTIMYYESHKGKVEKEVIQDSLRVLEEQFSNYNFFRTHRKYLINATKVVNTFNSDPQYVVLRHQLPVKLSINKRTNFIEYLEAI